MKMRQLATNFLKRFLAPSTSSLSPSSSFSSITTMSSTPFYISLSCKAKYWYNYGNGDFGQRMSHGDSHLWTIVVGQAAIILGINANHALADVPIETTSENDSDMIGLRKVEDGSVVSNIHTSKWRVFTDNGRDFFLQGKLDEAERFFLSALLEAKEGFGKRDPHVASACNNLAELYRIKKEFDKAEPLYLEAIDILEESFGPEDIRVGTALHNLGQFYLMQRKLEEARKCYEIKGRVLGLDHADYAETMFHLGMVLCLQGKGKDAEVLIQDSIRILEIYLKSNRLVEAENVQRKILHIMELSKGWTSMDTIIEAERFALILQSAGNLNEAQELLERCLDGRKKLLPEDHIQISANLLHIARVMMLKSNQLRKMHIAEAISELDKAKDLLYGSIRIAQQVLNKLKKQKGYTQMNGASEGIGREGRTALVILMQSLDALGNLEVTKQELLESVEEHSATVEAGSEAESGLMQCILAYKEFEAERLISDSPEVKFEYLSCLKHLLTLIGDSPTKEGEKYGKPNLQELKDEIKHVEADIYHFRKREP